MRDAVASIIKDQRLFDEVFAKLEAGQISKLKDHIFPEENMTELLNNTKSGIITPNSFDEFPLSKAIILEFGRPALLARGGSFELPESDVWKERLLLYQTYIDKAMQSVGRIELKEHDYLPWAGTGWLITDNIIVTNRHVALTFGKREGDHFVFSKNSSGKTIRAFIDFREEYDDTTSSEFEVEKILYIEKQANDRPDIAFLQIKKTDQLPDPLPVSNRAIRYDDLVAVIGYPARDQRNDEDVQDKIFKDIYNVKRLLPGRILDVPESSYVFRHDCSTLGGASGSVVIDLETGEALGVHFSGSYKVANLAVNAATLLEKLGELSVAVDGCDEDDLPEEEPLLDIPEDGREGYDDTFLGKEYLAPLPCLTERINEQGLIVSKSSTGMDRYNLKYTHFSVVMNKEREFAFYVACNIDGSQRVSVPRRQSANWRLDGRIIQEINGQKRFNQADNSLYKNNDLDRGHLVRRLDPVWGDIQTAKKANDDTFFYTNCSPQHKNFNQRSWLELEDWILDNTEIHDLKVCLFTGPVFKDTDMTYRSAQLPAEYWKVVALLVAEEDGPRFSATAYLLSQEDQLDDFESPFAFGAYKTYQVAISELEQLTGLDFGTMKSGDPLDGVEGVVRRRYNTRLGIIK